MSRGWIGVGLGAVALFACNPLGLRGAEFPRYDSCQVERNAADCLSLGTSLVGDGEPSRTATGWTLLRRACELDEGTCVSALVALEPVARVEYYDEIAALACGRPAPAGYADPAACFKEYRDQRDIAVEARAYREISAAYAAIGAGHPDVGRERLEEICARGVESGCKALAAHDAYQGKLAAERAESERRIAEIEAEGEALRSMPRAERARRAADACAKTGDPWNCDAAAYYDGGNDPYDDPAAFKRYRVSSRNPSCVTAYTNYRDPTNVRRYLAAQGELTEVPGRSPSRGPPYWKSVVLRRKTLRHDE